MGSEYCMSEEAIIKLKVQVTSYEDWTHTKLKLHFKTYSQLPGRTINIFFPVL